VTFIVMAPGYEPWIAQFQAGDDSTSINSTVKLIPKLPQAAAEPPVSGQTAARVGEAVLIFQSYIVDAKTKRPVIADVRLNGETVRWDITYLELEVPLDEEDFFQIKVVAPGYVPWMIEGRGHVNEDKRWQGPIQLVRQSSNPKASERPTF
jgi:hypothetical protein